MKEDAPSLVVSYHLSKLNKGCQPVKEKMSTSLALCKESNNSCSSRTRRVELLAHCEAPHGCAGEAIAFGKQLKRVVVNPDFLSSEDEKSVQHKVATIPFADFACAVFCMCSVLHVQSVIMTYSFL